MPTYIDNSAKLSESQYGENFKCYKNVVVSSSRFGNGCSVGNDTTVERCIIGNYVAINRRSYINDSVIGDFSYSGINTTMNFTRIGKFCSLARNVDIGGFDHDYKKVTTMPMFRFLQMLKGEKPKTKHDELCEIGNDVWIAAGAIVLHKVKIGDGAVIGAGAVVTKDVPPYAIVAGVPGKIIKYRFEESIIAELLKIKWWDWPIDVIKENIEWLIHTDMNADTLQRMKEIGDEKECKENIPQDLLRLRENYNAEIKKLAEHYNAEVLRITKQNQTEFSEIIERRQKELQKLQEIFQKNRVEF